MQKKTFCMRHIWNHTFSLLPVARWYYKGVTRERSEAILRQEAREGCFMVRDSSQAGMYTLSIFTNEG